MICKPRKSGGLGPRWAVAPQKKNQQIFTNESDFLKDHTVTACTVPGVSPPDCRNVCIHFVSHASISFYYALWITRLTYILPLLNERSYGTPYNPRSFSIRVTELVMQPLQPVFPGSWFSFKYPVISLPKCEGAPSCVHIRSLGAKSNRSLHKCFPSRWFLSSPQLAFAENICSTLHCLAYFMWILLRPSVRTTFTASTCKMCPNRDQWQAAIGA